MTLACLILSVLLVSANLHSLKQESKETTSLSLAIKEIMEKVAIQSNRIDILIYGTDHKLSELSEVLAGNEKVPIRVKRTVGFEPNVINETSVMIFESMEEFKSL